MTRYYHRSKFSSRSNSVNRYPSGIFNLTFLFLAISMLVSCEADPTIIGSEILPGNDFVNIYSIDTISPSSYTLFNPSLPTDNPTVSYIGQIYDPYFGSTTADLVTQVRLGSAWDGEPFTIDSVRLYLYLLDVKGDNSDVVHNLRFAEIDKQIYTDSVYYSNTNLPLTGYELANIELPVLRPDTINGIIVNLPVEFGNYLLRDTAQLFYSNTKPDYRSFFKGLLISMEPSADPLLISFSVASPTVLGSSKNAIVLFMHDDDNIPKQYIFSLDAINSNAAFNRFDHDFTTASSDKKIEHINDGYRDTLTYLQSLNGVYTKIAIPALETLKNDPAFDNIAVNKARLTIPVYFDGDYYTPSAAPPYLYLKYRTTDGSEFMVHDYGIDNYHTFFDGTIDTVANVYSFNIPRFVQEYLKDTNDEILPELELFHASGTQNLILKANDSSTPVTFEFIYTKF